MATVYLALDPRHNRKVAVKVLRPDLAATLGPARFLREIEIAAQLQHPHILPLLDSGESDGFLYYVMPYIEGESLRERLSGKGELPVAEATRLLRDVADALSYAHSRGVVHRDIKPDNVMLTGRHALVADFGVAKAVSEATGRQTMTTAGVALGTPAYMAPEQAAADPHVDHRADIYAMGAMGYELLTGRPPFTGLSPQQVLAAHVTEAPKPVTALREACPPALAEAVMRCLAKRAADRWQSADELLELLESLGTPSGGSTPTQTQPTRAVAAEDHWYGHPLRVAGLFTLAAVAILGVVYFLTIQFGLPDWVPRGALILLAAGFPIMVVTGLVERRRAQARATGTWSPSGEQGLHWITWRKAIRGGVVAFGVLAAGTLVYTGMRLLGIGPVGTLVASGRLAERDRMIVADFANATPDSSLGGALSEAFRIDLAQSPVISVLSSSALSQALQRMGRPPGLTLDPGVARELAQREGAKAILTGEVNKVGAGYVLAARLLGASDGAELLALRETAADDRDLLPAMDRLSKRLRERVGESLRSIRSNEPLEEVTTSSLSALRLYTEGVRAADADDTPRAEEMLRQAVTIDTGFAMAWRKLAVVLGNAEASQEQVMKAATQAYLHRNRLPEVERQLSVAHYYSRVAFDLDRTAAAYRSVLATDPDNNIALNNLALLLEYRHEYPEAERLFARAVEVGSSAVHDMGYVRILTAEGKIPEARRALDEFERKFPGLPAVAAHRAALATSLGEWDSARQILVRTRVGLRSALGRAFSARDLGTLEVIQGHLEQAGRYGEEAIQAMQERGLPGNALDIGVSLATMRVVFTGDTAVARKELSAALTRFPLESIPAPDRPYPALAIAYATTGQPDRARQVLREFKAAIPEAVRRGRHDQFFAEGYAALAEGRPREAIPMFREYRVDNDCTHCGLYDLGLAMERAGQPDSAIAYYQQMTATPRALWSNFDLAWGLARSYQRLGVLYEEKGRQQEAIDAYTKFVELWRDADPVLQPKVREAKDRLEKLAGEHAGT